MAITLGVSPQALYPAYYVEFRAKRRSSGGDTKFWNHISSELVRRGWTTANLARRCRISHWTVSHLVGWTYPPTRKILARLEKVFGKSRSEFWSDWKHQQWLHYDKGKGSGDQRE